MFELQLCGRRTGIKWYMLLFECMSKRPSIVCVPISKYPNQLSPLKIIYSRGVLQLPTSFQLI